MLQQSQVVGADLVESCGSRVELLPLRKDIPPTEVFKGGFETPWLIFEINADPKLLATTVTACCDKSRVVKP